MNIVGNVISGQVTGETAKQLSDRFGKIMQDRSSLSINSSDTSISKSQQLELAVPASTISTLSSGEFVGIIADDPNQKINLKAFHCEIVNKHDELKLEQGKYQYPFLREVDNFMVQKNYNQVKQEIEQLIQTEMDRIISLPDWDTSGKKG
jgi:TusA-related sulfurtransferase